MVALIGVRRALLKTGVRPVAYTDLTTTTSLPSFLTHSRPSLAMMVDASGKLTYCPNNLLTNSNNLLGTNWVTDGQAAITGANTFTLTGQSQVKTGSMAIPAGNYIVSAKISGTKTGKLFFGNVYGWNGGVLVDVTPAPTTVFVRLSYASNTYIAFGFSNYLAASSDGNNATITVSDMVLSAVTYETAPRSQDQVITTSAAYYGPRINSSGLLLEGAATNLFQNTSAPATHSVTVTAQAYTLSFYGTGSVTLSGAYSGTLNGPGAWPQSAPAKLTFTPTAGTLTITVSGSIQYPNLEAGSFLTSHIPNGATTTTRAADVVQIVGPGLAALQGAQASVVAEIIVPFPSNPSRVVGANGEKTPIYLNSSAIVGSWDGAHILTSTTGGGSLGGSAALRAAGAWSAAGRSLVFAAGNVSSDAYSISGITATWLGSDQGVYRYLNGYVSKLAIYNTRLPNGVLKAKTVLGAPL